MARSVRSRALASEGIAIPELLVAILILAVGILSTFAIFVSSKHSNRVSETSESATHLAQQELERVEALPYAQIGLTSAPGASSDPNNPGYYVSAPGSAQCPNFQPNQSSGSSTELVVVNGCTYYPSSTAYSGGSVAPTTAPGNGYAVYDFVTYVNDTQCAPGAGCPASNDYKRVTVEVTHPGSSTLNRTKPVLVSAVVADPHAVPLSNGGNVNGSNPIDSSNVTCTDGNGNQVTCNNGLGNDTPYVYYLTNSTEQGGYTAPSADNACMHYTDRQVPLSSGGVLQCGASTGSLTCSSTQQNACPQPDLMTSAQPPSTIAQEYNWSPNLASNPGRVIQRDPNATGTTPSATCAATPSQSASKGELWATPPLTSPLNLTGGGGMTLYTNTLSGATASVTLCVAIYLEAPPSGVSSGLLDPLNLLCGTCSTPNSTLLGTVAYTNPQWPTTSSSVSFNYSYRSSTQTVPVGDSIAARVWVANSSGDDIVVHYDAPSVASNLELNGQ